MDSKRSGFTLIEMLLVIALFGLISSIGISYFDQIQNAFSGKPQIPYKILESTIQQGRWLASQQHQTLKLTYQKNQLSIHDAQNQTIYSCNLPEKFKNQTVDIKFFIPELNAYDDLRPTNQEQKDCNINPDGSISQLFVKIQYDNQTEWFLTNIFSALLTQTTV